MSDFQWWKQWMQIKENNFFRMNENREVFKISSMCFYAKKSSYFKVKCLWVTITTVWASTEFPLKTAKTNNQNKQPMVKLLSPTNTYANANKKIHKHLDWCSVQCSFVHFIMIFKYALIQLNFYPSKIHKGICSILFTYKCIRGSLFRAKNFLTLWLTCVLMCYVCFQRSQIQTHTHTHTPNY